MSTTWTRRGMQASLLTALAVLCVPGPADAQDINAEPNLVSSNATLGGPFEWLVFAQPSKLVVLVPSLESGPTPLAILDPTSQLVMSIGLDLFSKGFVYSGQADHNGEFKTGITLPQSPNLAGLPLRAQAVTLFNSTGGLFDALSNVNSKTLKVSGQNVFTQGEVLEPRRGHTATALPDGRVLLIGGEQKAQGQIGSSPLVSMELFDPESETFVPVNGGKLTDPRSGHTSTFVEWVDPLSNTPREGVVVAGGINKKDSKVLSTVELIEFVDDMTVVTKVIGEMPDPRHMHTATATPDGRVLLIGGLPLPFDSDNPNVGLALQSWTSAHSSSVYIDPAQHDIREGPKLPDGIFGHSASLCCVSDDVPGSQAPIGQVYVTGGITRNLIVSRDAYVIDLLNDIILPQPQLLSPVAFHSQITLLDGPKPLRLEGREHGEGPTWVLMDFGGFVVHVFDEEARAFYDIERLWSDRPRLDWQAEA